MAKKARRKKQTVLTQSQLVGTRQQETVATSKVVVRTQKPEPTARTTVNFEKEYAYVIADLNRIGILAAVMFVILIALNLILR